MKEFKLIVIVIVSTFLYACEVSDPFLENEESFLVSTNDVSERANPNSCYNIKFNLEADLAPVVIIPTTPPIIGPGGLPTTVEIAGYSGMLSSVLTSAPSGNGADHFTLVHYFDAGNGNTFLTEDKAVCAPIANNDLLCLINDRMRIESGTEDFANVSGFMHNMGTLISIEIPYVGIVPVHLSTKVNGRICLN